MHYAINININITYSLALGLESLKTPLYGYHWSQWQLGELGHGFLFFSVNNIKHAPNIAPVDTQCQCQ